MKIDFDVRMKGTPDTTLVTTNEIPYSSNEGTQHREIRRSFRIQQMRNHVGNLLTRPDWHHTDLQLRLAYLLRRKKQELCKGIVRVALYLKNYSPFFTSQIGRSSQFSSALSNTVHKIIHLYFIHRYILWFQVSNKLSY